MLHIILIACILSVVRGAQYAYFDNNLVEFDDVPPQTISLPYPYQGPKAVRIEQRPISYDIGVRAVPQSQDLNLSPIGFICSTVTSIIGFVKRMIMHAITSLPALIFSFLGVCNFTSICNYININPLRYINDITSFVTTDRLKRATDFVETAIRKYTELQEESIS